MKMTANAGRVFFDKCRHAFALGVGGAPFAMDKANVLTKPVGMIANYLDMREKSGPAGFMVSFVLLSVAGTGVVKLIDAALHSNHHLSGIVIFLIILTGIVFASVVLTQAVKRVNDMGRAGILSICSLFPAVAVTLAWLFGVKTLTGGPLLVVTVLGVLGLIVMLLPKKA